MAKNQTLSEFSERLNNAIQKLPDNVNSLKRSVAIAVHSSLVESTPVMTGQARTNWRAYLNENEGEQLPPPDNAESGMSAAKAQAASVINQAPANATIYIVNRAQHIQKLNQGWSVQAPSEFVRIAALRAALAVSSKATSKHLMEFR